MREQASTRKRTPACSIPRSLNQNGKPIPRYRRRQPGAAGIAEALEGRQTGPNQWIACCPAHDDKHPSLSLSDGDRGLLLNCFAGCSRPEVISALRERGLWWQPGREQTYIPKHRDNSDALFREACRTLTAGLQPTRNPPYTRYLSATGPVRIITGPRGWAIAKVRLGAGRPVLVWPYDERRFIPFLAFHWPVVNRHVRVFDTLQLLMPDEAWNAVVEDFGRYLVERCGAACVEIFGDFEPIRYRPEVRHAV